MANQHRVVSKSGSEVDAPLCLGEAEEYLCGMTGRINLERIAGDHSSAEGKAIHDKRPAPLQSVAIRDRMEDRQNLLLLLLPYPKRNLLYRLPTVCF